jgi:glutamate/tyrosine decarboxylase-like PLP-dependent enzyme
MEHDPLGVDPETMRRLGYQTVDWLVERAQGRCDEPVLRQSTPEAIAAQVPQAIPTSGQELGRILDHLGTEVLPYRSRIDHPRYLAYIPGEGTWPAALGDLIASTYNIDVGNWMESSGPSQLEITVLRWCAEWIGYPSEARGVLVSGGSAANLTALACAREALVGAMSDDLVVYVSEQAHSSLARAARVLGFKPQQVRVLPVDTSFRMRVDALEAAIKADAAAGARPLAVLAVAGTTNTGAVDDLPALAEVCRRYGVWLHVDGAYGAFAALTARGRDALTGLELADSVTLDPHKWLYQPFECGALLVRQGQLLREAFEIHPSYLQDAAARNGEINFADQGLQLTRMSRALKLWLSLQYFGADAFAAAIDRAMDLAQHAEARIRDSAELELLAPATLGIVCFRRHPLGRDDEADLERVNTGVVEGLARSGDGLVSSTRLFGRYAVRICVLNHSTGRDDVDRVLDWLLDAPVPEPEEVDSGRVRAAPLETRTADVTVGWPGVVAAEVEELQAIPLFSDVEPRVLRWVGSVATRRQVEAGQTVVRQWDVDRDFYLLLEGDADVLSQEQRLGSMQAGDFFGELAALDWGASFGYPRLATVKARTDLVLLVLTDVELAELMSWVPAVDTRIRAAAAERATRL